MLPDQTMTKVLIFLIGLLIPTAKPCLSIVAQWHRDTAIQCLQSLPALEPKLKLANFFLRRPEITAGIDIINDIKPFLPHADYFLGTDKPATYLVLLQNNHELRANGGFFGSYAVVTVSPPKPEISFRFQDIYVPDGALVGRVDPPTPIQTAFKQGWWRLRDSDWEPDFLEAAKTIRWFLTKGSEINPDILVTLNLATIEKIAAVIGKIDIPEYGLQLTADNLYSLLQNKAEIAFFPGSTQKRDVLTAAGTALSKKISHLEFTQYVQLVQILLDQLNHSNLLVNSTNPEIQNIILSKDWAGKLITPQGCEGCLNDTVLLVETNLGANKANCCIDRQTVHTISYTPYAISHLINLTFTNNSPLENPLPPRFFGGNYISYLRYYLPDTAKNIRLTAQPTLPKTITQYPIPFDGIKQKLFDRKFNYGLTEIGFFHTTAAGTKSAVQLSYDLPIDGNPVTYQLNLLKQNGLTSSPQEINLFGKDYSTPLENNYFLSKSLSSNQPPP